MSDFARKSLSDLITQAQNDLNGRIPGADSRLRRSFLGAIARVIAGGLNILYGYVDYLALQLLPSTATDLSWILRHGSQWGLTLKAATPAKGPVDVSGAIGAVIPAGTELQRVDQAIFTVDADVTLTGLTGTVQVTAVTLGQGGNTAEGTSLTFVSPVSQVSSDAVVGDGGLTQGTDAETPAQLQARTLQRIQNPPQGGAKSDYERWALEVAGVTRVWVYPNWMGPGTVGITFVMDGRVDIVPTEDDLDAVIAHIEPLRPATAELVVFAPVLTPVAYTMSLVPNTLAVQNAVKAEIADLHTREAEPGGTLLLSDMNQAISLANGETDHVLTLPAGNVTATAGHLLVPGTITFV
jgi:uncharacterized phage protein gp47/JayE